MLVCISNSFYRLAINVRCKMVETIDVLWANLRLLISIKEIRNALKKEKARTTVLKIENKNAMFLQQWAFSLLRELGNMLNDNKGTILLPRMVRDENAKIEQLTKILDTLQIEPDGSLFDYKMLTEDQVLSLGQHIVNNNPSLIQLTGLQKR